MLRIWLALGACLYGYVTGGGKGAAMAFITCMFVVYAARTIGLLAMGQVDKQINTRMKNR